MGRQTQWLFEVPVALGIGNPIPSGGLQEFVGDSAYGLLAPHEIENAIQRNQVLGKTYCWENYIPYIFQILESEGYLAKGYGKLVSYYTNSENFVLAVAGWQEARGLEPDGKIGKNTWPEMWAQIQWLNPNLPQDACRDIKKKPQNQPSKITPGGNEDRLFRQHKRGYSRSGGGRLDSRLRQLRASGQLSLSDDDIDMFQRIANVETGGNTQAINSWDTALMSMGFKQWTVLHNKLQNLIQRVPHAFRRYGIALDSSRQYTIQTNYGTLKPIAIQGVLNPNDLRSLDWAKRFYSAGLDTDVIVASVEYALEESEKLKRKLLKEAGSFFLPHYQTSPILRALIQAVYNNRPAYISPALKRATAKAKQMQSIVTEQFLDLVQAEIRHIYDEKEKALKKANNIIDKTSRLVL